ncbi:hypothetical protein [Flavimarina sp. Hel_I_48]|uniref:hypothetical protein n=1 Tax=Flavimarina sp. Hel_I_48 TaxID=1392488 RepID=UPI0013DA39DA|nr:hypothetical protein [Flavimarina sp. Hel_I_48]
MTEFYMKNVLLFLLILFNLPCLQAQVGIGTVDPQDDLHVIGNTLVQESMEIGALPFVQDTDADFKLLTRLTNSQPKGQVAVLNVDELQVAPVNVVNYEFTGISKDNLRDVNLQYDADKYIVGLANFRYVGDAILKKDLSNGNISVGDFVSRTFVDNGTWHLEIRNRFLDLSPSKSLEYHITLIIYDKSYYRNLPEIVTDLGGNNTGTASSTPNLY